MPSKKNAFGKRGAQVPDDFEIQETFPPSRAERLQTLWMYGTIGIAVVVLGIGMLLRFTVFAKMFEPPTYAPPAASNSPIAPATPSAAPPVTPSPEPSATPSPTPSPALSAPGGSTSGEPITPSLEETGGRVVLPR